MMNIVCILEDNKSGQQSAHYFLAFSPVDLLSDMVNSDPRVELGTFFGQLVYVGA